MALNQGKCLVNCVIDTEDGDMFTAMVMGTESLPMPFSCLAKRRIEVTQPTVQHRLAVIAMFSLPLDGERAAAHWEDVQKVAIKRNLGVVFIKKKKKVTVRHDISHLSDPGTPMHHQQHSPELMKIPQ